MWRTSEEVHYRFGVSYRVVTANYVASVTVNWGDSVGDSAR